MLTMNCWNNQNNKKQKIKGKNSKHEP